jgi:hypothetical protein
LRIANLAAGIGASLLVRKEDTLPA